jgi:hypothetical protein
MTNLRRNYNSIPDLTPIHKDKATGVHGAGTAKIATTTDITTAIAAHTTLTDPHTGYVLESLFDAHSMIASSADNTPYQFTVGEQTLVGRVTGGNIAALSNTALVNLFHAFGLHHGKACTYIDGTGTAGADGTAQTVKSVTLPANSASQLGDRVRVRVYWRGDTGAAITATTTVNAVTVSHTTDIGGASFYINEVYLHYIDNTHANIIETENGSLGALSAANVAGFDWDSDQTIAVAQDNVANNHIVVIAVIVDCFPKGII